MYDKYKIVVFNDSIGRTCFGEIDSENDSDVNIKNPAMIMVSPNETGQMKVDVIPLFFAEFIDDDNKECVFTFRKNNITLINVKLTQRILEHYFTKINIKETEQDNQPELKLFD